MSHTQDASSKEADKRISEMMAVSSLLNPEDIHRPPTRIGPQQVIRLNDRPSHVTTELGLSIEDAKKFRFYARRVCRRYCETHPTSQWAHLSIPWDHIPENEKCETVDLLIQECERIKLFQSTSEPPSPEVIRQGCTHRMRRARRYRNNQKREKAQQDNHFVLQLRSY